MAFTKAQYMLYSSQVSMETSPKSFHWDADVEMKKKWYF